MKNIIKIKENKFNFLIDLNTKCQIMNSSLYGDVLACFNLTNEFPYSLSINLFEIKNELKQLSTKNYYKLLLLNKNFNTVISKDKKKVIIYFMYNYSINFFYYLIETNTFVYLIKASLSSRFNLIEKIDKNFLEKKFIFILKNKIFYLLKKEKIINKNNYNYTFNRKYLINHIKSNNKKNKLLRYLDE